MLDRFGPTCSSVQILTTISIAYARYPRFVDLEFEHMNLVRKIAGISENTSCPQRVPTFREYERLASDWSKSFDEPAHEHGWQIITQAVARSVEEDIVSRERSAKLARIDAFRAAA